MIGLLGAAIHVAAQTVLPPIPGLRSDPVVAGRLKVRLTRDVPPELHAWILKSAGLEILYAVLPPEHTVYRTQPDPQPLERSTLEMLEEQLTRSYVCAYSDSIIPEKKIRQLGELCSFIDCCSPVYVGTLTAEPNDPKVVEQLMLSTIRAFDAWDVERGSASVLIGISDSGVLQDHEDLADALFVNVDEIPDNGIDDDGNGYVDDYRGYNFCTADDGTPPGNTFNKNEGHGTGVAGICGATVNNAVGIAGVANACKMVPLKTMPDNSGGIIYGYESLMYCAVNNIQVVNCSWGSNSKSCIDENIVAYTIARGTAIVAAAGNHGTSAPFYPGSYPGVLNVGVTDPDDNVIAMSAYGPTVDVMAPGQFTVTTSNDGTYGSFCCTSGSSPIAAAVVGLVRSKYPELSPLQACALVRESATPAPWKTIHGQSPVDLLPFGRLNALQAVTYSPDSMPSVEWDSVHVIPRSQDVRWGVGDTIDLTLYGTNILADWQVEEVRDLRVVGSQPLAVRLLSSQPVVLQQRLTPGAQVVVQGVACEVLRETDSTVHVVGTLVGRTGGGQQHLRNIQVAVIPSPSFRTLSNASITTSVGDRARIGNTDIQRSQGAGFTYRQYCGQLYECGLMVTANGKVVDAIRGTRTVNNHFRPVKPFDDPEPTTCVVNDADAPDSARIGIQVELNVTLDSGGQGILIVDGTLTNIGAEVLHNVAIGWFQDWDLGSNPGHNSARQQRTDFGNTVYLHSDVQNQPRMYSYAESRHSDAVAVACAMDNATTYREFSHDRKRRLLLGEESSGVFTSRDVACVTGVHFQSPLHSGAVRTFRQVFLLDTSDRSFQQLSAIASSVPHRADTLFVASEGSMGEPYPQPSWHSVSVPVSFTGSGRADVYLCDMQGRCTKNFSLAYSGPSVITIDVSDVATGMYQMIVVHGSRAETQPILVLR